MIRDQAAEPKSYKGEDALVAKGGWIYHMVGAKPLLDESDLSDADVELLESYKFNVSEHLVNPNASLGDDEDDSESKLSKNNERSSSNSDGDADDSDAQDGYAQNKVTKNFSTEVMIGVKSSINASKAKTKSSKTSAPLKEPPETIGRKKPLPKKSSLKEPPEKLGRRKPLPKKCSTEQSSKSSAPLKKSAKAGGKTKSLPRKDTTGKSSKPSARLKKPADVFRKRKSSVSKKLTEVSIETKLATKKRSESTRELQPPPKKKLKLPKVALDKLKKKSKTFAKRDSASCKNRKLPKDMNDGYMDFTGESEKI